MPANLRVKLVKSPVSHTARIRATVRALGLHRIGETVEVADTPEMRGMVRTVRFLVTTEEAAQGPATVPANDPSPGNVPARTSKKTREATE